MVEHRNVVDFFAGMDAADRARPAGVWLAVTSLSFDISVLELFWTLTRGFTVVVQGDGAQHDHRSSRRRSPSRRPIDLSLFYFASDEGEPWRRQVPAADGGREVRGRERLPRRLDAGAALPRVRRPLPQSRQSRAPRSPRSRRASRSAPAACVLPLHHPIRVAEEWSLVDNLSGGRVGVSFASGWHPDDFVLRPEAFANAKHGMMVGASRRSGASGAASASASRDHWARTCSSRPCRGRCRPSCRCGSRPPATPRRFALAGEAGC